MRFCVFILKVLLLIGLSVGGSLVMRKYRTSLAVGFFLGVVIIMSQTMLVLFAVFAGRASTTDDSDEKPADRAFAAFCFFLWLVYTAFAGERTHVQKIRCFLFAFLLSTVIFEVSLIG